MKPREVFKKMLPIYMDRARMNQAELAKAVGKSEASASLWVAGKVFPKIDTIQRIADVLGCRTDDLLFETVTFKVTGYSDKKQTDEMNEYWYRLNSKNKKAVFDLMKALAESQEE